MNKPWTDKIRQRMGHYEPQAPEGLYDDIMGEMARRGMLPQGQSQHRAGRCPRRLPVVCLRALSLHQRCPRRLRPGWSAR